METPLPNAPAPGALSGDAGSDSGALAGPVQDATMSAAGPAADQVAPQTPAPSTPTGAPVSEPAPSTQAPAPATPAQTSQPSFFRRLALGALMGLAHGGIGGAAIGALEASSSHQFGVMAQHQQDVQTVQHATATKAAADAATEPQMREAELKGMNAKTALDLATKAQIDETVSHMDQKAADEHLNTMKDVVSGFSTLYGTLPEYVPSHGQTAWEYLKGLGPDAINTKFAIGDGEGFWVFDRTAMNGNSKASAELINSKRLIEIGPTAPLITPAQFQADYIQGGKRFGKEFEDALDRFSASGTTTGSARSNEVRLRTGLTRLQKSPGASQWADTIQRAQFAETANHQLAEQHSIDEQNAFAAKRFTEQTLLKPMQGLVDGVPKQGDYSTFSQLGQQGHKIANLQSIGTPQYQKNVDKMNRYKTDVSAMNDYGQAFADSTNNDGSSRLTTKEMEAVKYLTAPDKVSHSLVMGAEGMASGAVGDFIDSLTGRPFSQYSEKLMGSQAIAENYDKLGPVAQKLVSTYWAAALANLAQNRDRLNAAPRNESLIQIELHTLPQPYFPFTQAREMFRSRKRDMAGSIAGTPETLNGQ